MMTQILFTDQYTDIYELSLTKKVLKFLWKETSEFMTKEAYKEHVILWANTVQEKRPDGILVDTRKHLVAINLELQQWFVDIIFPKYAASGMKKFAFIKSEDYISQISIEQTMDEDPSIPFKTRYFSQETEALEWILA